MIGSPLPADDAHAVELRLRRAMAELELEELERVRVADELTAKPLVVLTGRSLDDYMRGLAHDHPNDYPRPLGAVTFTVTPRGAAALAGDDNTACEYCSCTEVAPCELTTAQLSPAVRAELVEYFQERGEQLPDTIPCWWSPLADEQTAVCSNPHCEELHRAKLAGVTP